MVNNQIVNKNGVHMLQLKDIHKCFRDGEKGERRVLSGVNLDVEKGDFVAITGVSGAGKTTLLNIMGLVCEADEGECWLNGEKVSPTSVNVLELRNRHIGFVFQDSRLLPHLTAWQNVLLPVLAGSHTVDGESESWAERLMQMVGVNGVRHQPTETLSGGEKARVALCRALVMHPDLLLADEPTGQLDEATAKEIGDVLTELNQKLGISIVVVTHDRKLASVARRIYHLENGNLNLEL